MLAHQIPVILGTRFDPSVIFAEMPGAWLEPRIGYMWQENTGTTPTTAAGQTIGRINDLSGYGYNATQATATNRPTLQYVNGMSLARCDSNDFMTVALGAINLRKNLLSYTEQLDNAIWVKTSATVTPNTAPGPFGSSADTIDFTANAAANVYQSLTGTNGTYTFSVYVKTASGTKQFRLYAYNVVQGNMLSSDFTATTDLQLFSFTVTVTTSTAFYIRNSSGGNAGSIIASAAQVESGPTATSYQKITDWTSEQFSSSGSVYFALLTGMSALHNQSIGTSYSAPIQSMDLYGVVIVPSRLSDQREAQLQTYFEKLAGLR